MGLEGVELGDFEEGVEASVQALVAESGREEGEWPVEEGKEEVVGCR